MKVESAQAVESVEQVSELSITALLATGKRDLLVGDSQNALKYLQRAVALTSAKYGTFAIECGEAYYLFGCALLDRARSENEVLGEAVKGVPLEEKNNEAEAEGDAEADGKASNVVSDSEADGAEPSAQTDREKLADLVIDALCAVGGNDAEKTPDAEKADAEKADAEKTAEVKTTEAEGESKANEADEQSESTTKPKEADGAKENENGENGEDSGDSAASVDGSADEADDDDEDGEGEGEGEGDGDGEGEERTTLGVAWEWLDLARIVFEKRYRTLTGEEACSSRQAEQTADDAKQAEECAAAAAAAAADDEPLQCPAKDDSRRCAARLADSHLRLGEVLMERAEFDAAIGEFEATLRIREKQRETSSANSEDAQDEERVDGEMRALAEAHFQLGLAYQNAEKYDDAMRAFQHAIETLAARRTQLASRLERAEKESESAKRLASDIEDLDGILSDLRQRVTDAEDEKRFKALAQSEAGATTSTSFGASSSDVATSDASHLVKRKRKPDTDGDEKENGSHDAAPAHKDADANGDGVAAKSRKVEEDGTTNA